jgi:hypothetical protein
LKNSQIGRNLHLHPSKCLCPGFYHTSAYFVIVILAITVFDKETRPWEGSALTTVVNEFEDLDARGHE